MRRALLILFATTSLAHAGRLGTDADPAKRDGDEIRVAGVLVHTGGATVVLWDDPGGMDLMPMSRGAITRPAVAGPTTATTQAGDGGDDEEAATPIPPRTIRGPGVTREQVRESVDQIVMHFDACGVSSECFAVLKRRRLSIQFMVDLDGTIYQAMDIREAAQHATIANARSVGIEIANLGAFAAEGAIPAPWRDWYTRDRDGTRVTIPEKFPPLRTPDFVPRPARPMPVLDVVQGLPRRQYDFTREQYQALAKLTATLCTQLPNVRPDFPRQRATLGRPGEELMKDAPPGAPTTRPEALAAIGQAGALIPHALTPAQFASFRGVVGHYHVQTNKNDPGPAFQWVPLMIEVRRLIAAAGRDRAPTSRPATSR